MSSAFQRVRIQSAATSPRPRDYRGSSAFRVALAAGVLAAVVSWLGGQYLVEAQYREESKEIGNHLEGMGSKLSQSLVVSLDRGDLDAALGVIQTQLSRYPGANAAVLDAEGQLLVGPISTNTWAALTSHKDWEIPSLHRGRLGDTRAVEWQGSIFGRQDSLGTLALRLPVPGPVWAGALFNFTAATSLFAAVVTFLYLSSAFRGVAGLRRVLERISQGDYCERAAVVGCSEIKTLIRETHHSLDAFILAGEEAHKVYAETAIALSKTIEAKDRYTSGHSQRVAVYSVEIGDAIGLPPERVETLRLGALLHDIGKVSTPDHVLLKPGQLTDEEFELMKKHPMAGDRILSAIPGLRDMADIARSHHEKWDGSGYPMGVSGDSIPLEGRIVAIADAYDALVTKRSYKPAMPVAKVLAILEKDAGSHFDPDLVQVFVAMKRNGQGYKPLKKGKASMEAKTKANPQAELQEEAELPQVGPQPEDAKGSPDAAKNEVEQGEKAAKHNPATD